MTGLRALVLGLLLAALSCSSSGESVTQKRTEPDPRDTTGTTGLSAQDFLAGQAKALCEFSERCYGLEYDDDQFEGSYLRGYAGFDELRINYDSGSEVFGGITKPGL